MKPSILVSHPFGNANVREAALAFAEVGALAKFHTCINWPEKTAWNQFLPSVVLQQMKRRTFPASVSAKTIVDPVREIGRLTAMKLGLRSLIRHETGAFSVDAVMRHFDARIARQLLQTATPPSAIYAYEDGAASSFAAAKTRNIRCFYDLPIGYWKSSRAIQSEEAEREPKWAETLTAMIDSPAKIARKDAELADADAIFVASQFTAKTLRENGISTRKIHILPYGCPSPVAAPAPTHSGPLRVLFAGSLGQRKGLSYLLAAVESLGKNVTLTLLGSRPNPSCAPLDRALKRHRWLPTLPHCNVLREMHEHDVLVFPSLFEGFGLVITEALSQGIPVITTAHTAGPDLISEGEDGYIIPIRDSPAIAERLEMLLGSPAHLQNMKNAALQKAKVLTWHKYRLNLVAEVFELLK